MVGVSSGRGGGGMGWWCRARVKGWWGVKGWGLGGGGCQEVVRVRGGV